MTPLVRTKDDKLREEDERHEATEAEMREILLRMAPGFADRPDILADALEHIMSKKPQIRDHPDRDRTLDTLRLWVEQEATKARKIWTRERVRALFTSHEFQEELDLVGPCLHPDRDTAARLLLTAHMMDWDRTIVQMLGQQEEGKGGER